MKNIYFYLQPGGILRIIVPDLEAYIKVYIEKRQEESTLAKAAPDFMVGSGLGYAKTRSTFTDRFSEIFANSRHQWMWDEPSLSEALIKHGFKNIRRCQYGEWEDSRFKAIENKKRHWKSLCLEATK